jgi:hypothetical protein
LGTTDEAAVSVSVLDPEPGDAMTPEEENCTVIPEGNPVTEKVIDALKVEFGVVVTVRVPDFPAATLTDVAEGDSVKVGAGAMARETEAVCFNDPLVAVTVNE